MKGAKITRVGALLAMGACAGGLFGCAGTQYRGYDSGIDGVLWRQVASFEDPLLNNVLSLRAQGEDQYFDGLDPTIWNGSEGAVQGLDLERGGVVFYDISSTPSVISFSVFISSGSRADGPTDDGRRYVGPSTVFTCYGIETENGQDVNPSVNKTDFSDCPPLLVQALPDDAAFASGDVFDG